MKKKHKKWLLFLAVGIIILFFGIKNMEKVPTGDGETVTDGNGGGGDGGDGIDGGGPCPTCSAIFLEGNPGIITDGISNPFFRPWKAFAQGHWNCQGDCTPTYGPGFNCVIDPTDVIPEDGFDSLFGERPDCVCLPKKPGPCNFYDANYGEGIDNLMCGGSCPPGQSCSYWVDSVQGKEFCQCLNSVDFDKKKCSLHVPDNFFSDNPQDFQKFCYGWCPESGTPVWGSMQAPVPECQFWIDERDYPHCDCFGPDYEPEPENFCSQIDIVADDGSVEWWKCWTEGECPNTIENCQYDQEYQRCACVSGNVCDWHLSKQQASELYETFGGDFDAAVGFVLDNWQMYCYGSDCGAGEACYYMEKNLGDGRTILDCDCYSATTPDFDLLASQLPLSSQILGGGSFLR